MSEARSEPPSASRSAPPGPRPGAGAVLRAAARVRRHPILLALPIVLLPFLVGFALSAWWTCGFAGCPDPDSLSVYQPDGASLLLDRDGEPLAELAPPPSEVIDLDDVPVLVREAFLAVEVRRFREHDGVDWTRLGGAAPYSAEAVRRRLEECFGPSIYSEPVRVWTTLDRRAQDAAVLLDARSGDVLAWVGGRDFETSSFDRVSHARRQPGSAFKPFVLAAALAEGRPLSTVLDDTPLTVELDGGRTWSPKTFDDEYDGRVSVREALVRSKNVATVRLAQEVGTGAVADLAVRAGIEPPISREPAMALGTVDVSPLELARAYGAFAGLGRRVEPRMILRVSRPDGEVLWESEPESDEVLDPAVAYLVNHVLFDAVRRGTGRGALSAGARGAVAGKTGTSDDNTDAWFAGDDLAGWWDLETRIRSSELPRYEGLRLGFRVYLEQDGERLTGHGEKIVENGESLPAGRRTPIDLSGSVDGREVTLRITERGSRRASAGTLRLALTPDRSTMSGGFRSGAASARSNARMMRSLP